MALNTPDTKDLLEWQIVPSTSSDFTAIANREANNLTAGSDLGLEQIKREQLDTFDQLSPGVGAVMDALLQASPQNQNQEPQDHQQQQQQHVVANDEKPVMAVFDLQQQQQQQQATRVVWQDKQVQVAAFNDATGKSPSTQIWPGQLNFSVEVPPPGNQDQAHVRVRTY